MAAVIKRSVSVAIMEGSKVLIVQRPPDDEDLPNEWGLPAASLAENESWQEAVQRAGREKLGVALQVGEELERGVLERTSYTLEMRLYDASILRGEPHVPQSYKNVTQYRAWRWGTAGDLESAAGKGSLCCRLFQKFAGRS